MNINLYTTDIEPNELQRLKKDRNNGTKIKMNLGIS